MNAPALSIAERLAALPAPARAKALAGLTDAQCAALEYDWEFWGRPNQLPPKAAANGRPWAKWAVVAGRGFGKTRLGCEWVRSVACGPTPLAPGAATRIALVAETAADGRDVLVEGESGLLAIHPKAFRPNYEPSKRRLTWPNGVTATLFNAVEPDQLRGPQHSHALCDELAKWRYARETWDQLQFGMRLGAFPQQCVTTTPRPIPVLREIMRDPMTAVTRGRTADNAGNLAPSFLRTITERYAGTRLGRQELEAEILDDVPGALWDRAVLDAAMVREVPAMRRIVVAVDPSGTKGGTKAEGAGDDIGIVAAGKGIDGRGYVLGDWSVNLSPAGWGARAVAAAKHFGADCIVAEGNFGGAMVEAVIKAANPKVRVKMVSASRGKIVRAEPVAALYEQGRVSHHKPMPKGAHAIDPLDKLEAQLCAFTPDGYVGEGSPDRADAAVWALTELMLGDGYVADWGAAL